MTEISTRAGSVITSILILGCLLLYSSRYIQGTGWDLVQHFMLVDEIMKNAGVSSEAFDRIGPMALYPSGAHWMAAAIGWITGSGLIGITVVSTIAVYGCYLIISVLVAQKCSFGSLLLVCLFFLISKTRALIGWEVVNNFFYPQLVADLLYLSALLVVSRTSNGYTRTLVPLGFGLCTMWFQPLIALHILAFGCVIAFVEVVRALWSRPQARTSIPLLLLACETMGSIAIVWLHPALATMRGIAANDGTLEFGFRNLFAVAVPLALIGIINVWRYLARRTEFADAVLGSAVIAAVGLAFIQFAMFAFLGEGSLYAVKKHFFVITTVGAINLIRLVTGLPWVKNRTAFTIPFTAPAAAGVMSFVILIHFDTPARPFIDALNYAEHAARHQLSGFSPGNTVYDDPARPLIENVMVSVTAFKHPFDDAAKGWLLGAPIKAQAEFVMLTRSPELQAQCPQPVAENAAYVIVRPACMRRYRLGQTLRFERGGNGWAYAQEGWSVPGGAGVWTLGDQAASLTLEIAETSRSGDYRLSVDGLAYLGQRHPLQIVTVEVNGTQVAKWVFDDNHPPGLRTALVPRHLVSGLTRILFRSPDSVSPAQMEGSSDTRILGLGVKTIVLSGAGH